MSNINSLLLILLYKDVANQSSRIKVSIKKKKHLILFNKYIVNAFIIKVITHLKKGIVIFSEL